MFIYRSNRVLKNAITYQKKFYSAKNTRIKKMAPNPDTVQRYREMESLLEKDLDLKTLNQEEIAIHDAHQAASKQFHFSYVDPSTGLLVMTRLKHFLRGTCCGNACRHVSV